MERIHKILFVITQSEIGGAQQFLARLISGLDRDKFFCSIVVGADGKNALKDLLSDNVEYVIAKNLRRNPSIFHDILSLFELRNILRKTTPDILFLNSSKAGFNGSLAAKFLASALPNLRIIYRIGGWSFNDPRPWWQKRFLILLEKISAHWKDYIIVNNKKDLEDAVDFKIKPRKELLLIHNGINPFMDFLDRQDARIKLYKKIGGQAALFQADHVVGTIANFYPAKGLSDLIQAAGELPHNAVLIIIGDGVLRNKIERQISSLGLETKVYLAGRIDSAYKYIRAFDVFVLASVKEGFPWVILEAMAAKVPVIATTVGAAPEVIEDNKNGLLVPSRNPLALVKAMKYILQNPDLSQELTIQAHQTIINNFNLHSMIQKYEKLFMGESDLQK